MGVRRALHFVFKVADRAQTIRFYREVLGMRVSEGRSWKVDKQKGERWMWLRVPRIIQTCLTTATSNGWFLAARLQGDLICDTPIGSIHPSEMLALGMTDLTRLL